MSFACRSASSVGGQQVAGELLADELVVGQVAVEGVDHPVAVAVHLRDRVVGVVAGGVGVADDVEPVPAPALAVGRRGEQPVDDLRERVAATRRSGRRRSPRASAAGRSGRRSRGGSACACRRAAPASGPSPSSFARMKRSIALRGHACVLDGRDGRVARPAGTTRTPSPSPGRGAWSRSSPVRGSGAPIFTHASRSAISAAGELLLGGIFRSLVGVADGLDEQALLRVAGHDRRAGRAALEHARRACRGSSSPVSFFASARGTSSSA